MNVVWIAAWFFIGLASDCRAGNFKLSSSPIAKVYVVNQQTKDQKFMGETPIELDTNDLSNQTIRVISEGKIPVNYAFADMLDNDEIKIPLTRTEAQNISSHTGQPVLQQINRVHGETLQALGALYYGQHDRAERLARKILEHSPSVSAAFVIQAISAMQLGQKNRALQYLATAHALDPSDRQIDKLIQLLQ
jgi:hypothetical protein